MKNYRCIFGPPGTGKTTKLVSIIQGWVDSGIKPKKIAVVSFTKAGAAELAERSGAKGALISTVHSLAFRMSGTSKVMVPDAKDFNEFSKISGIITTGVSSVYEGVTEVGDAYLALYSKLRNQGKYKGADLRREFVAAGTDGTAWQFEHFCAAYDQWKAANGMRDFTDMLELALAAPRPDVQALVVDEAQDLSDMQWRLVRYWAESEDVREVVIAGDDDQSIYAWGGAEPSGMADFARDTGAEIEVLSQSWRIPAAVHRVAEGIISHIHDRVPKEYKPRAEEGKVSSHSDLHTVPWKEIQSDCMVLFRNHSIRRDLEDFLMQQGILYTAKGGFPAPVDSWMGQAVAIWQRITNDWFDFRVCNATDAQLRPLLRYLKPSYRGPVERRNLSKIFQLNWSRVLNLPFFITRYFKRLEATGPDLVNIEPDMARIELSTWHASKGREAENVVVINGMNERTLQNSVSDPDSEIRTVYVAITRAKRNLHIVRWENPTKVLK